MATETVKIVRFHKIGGPEVLQLDELPLPEPGVGEVRLRVKAIGLNRAEALFRQDRHRFPPKLPSKLGYEASGIAAIEMAKAQGAISIATTRTARKKTALLGVGADEVIVTDEENLPKRVSEITGGMGARVVFDPIGGRGLEALAAAAARSGIIFQYGLLATEPTPYPLLTALSKHLTIKAYSLFEVVANPDEFPEQFRKAKQYVFDSLAKGVFKPRIGKIFPLSQIVDAHRYLESNAQVGKIVVTV
jgi:NADPH:quinone reductase-like Zn-dependent oxidoreductase